MENYAMTEIRTEAKRRMRKYNLICYGAWIIFCLVCLGLISIFVKDSVLYYALMLAVVVVGCLLIKFWAPFLFRRMILSALFDEPDPVLFGAMLNSMKVPGSSYRAWEHLCKGQWQTALNHAYKLLGSGKTAEHRLLSYDMILFIYRMVNDTENMLKICDNMETELPHVKKEAAQKLYGDKIYNSRLFALGEYDKYLELRKQIKTDKKTESRLTKLINSFMLGQASFCCKKADEARMYLTECSDSEKTVFGTLAGQYLHKMEREDYTPICETLSDPVIPECDPKLLKKNKLIRAICLIIVIIGTGYLVFKLADAVKYSETLREEYGKLEAYYDSVGQDMDVLNAFTVYDDDPDDYEVLVIVSMDGELCFGSWAWYEEDGQVINQLVATHPVPVDSMGQVKSYDAYFLDKVMHIGVYESKKDVPDDVHLLVKFTYEGDTYYFAVVELTDK